MIAADSLNWEAVTQEYSVIFQAKIPNNESITTISVFFNCLVNL